MPGVLVVDDEPAIRELLAEVLRNASYQVVLAANAAEALAAAQRHGGFDIALVDKNLPDRSGLELIGELKALLPEAEVIVITAYASLDSAIEAISAGACDYLRKPFDDIHLLNEKIEAALRKARLSAGKKLVYKHLLESEETFRQAFESAVDPMVVYDGGSGRVLDANQAAVALYGYDVDELRELDAEQLSPGAVSLPGGLLLRQDRRKDGSMRYVEVSSSIIDVQGRARRVELLRDVTRERIDLAGVVRSMEARLRVALGDTALTIAAPTEPCEVRIRRTQAEQILLEIGMAIGGAQGRLEVRVENRQAAASGGTRYVLLTFVHAGSTRTEESPTLARLEETITQIGGRFGVTATSDGAVYQVALPAAG